LLKAIGERRRLAPAADTESPPVISSGYQSEAAHSFDQGTGRLCQGRIKPYKGQGQDLDEFPNLKQWFLSAPCDGFCHRSESAAGLPLAFVGSASLVSDIGATAATMRAAFKLDIEERRKIPTWTKTLSRLIEQADALGILVMVNGVVGNNNYRRSIRRSFAALRFPMRLPL
jgi:hypothetical protein